MQFYIKRLFNSSKVVQTSEKYKFHYIISQHKDKIKHKATS